MKLTEHLDKIYQLVLDRADPAKVRVHIELIRDQTDAAGKIEAKLRKQIARDKKSHVKEVAALKNENAKIEEKLAKLEKQYQQSVAQHEREREQSRKPSRGEQLERAGL
jgi:low affinity Fe/Cu permease